MNKRAFGETIESEVGGWLETQGLKILESNYLCKLGEIDLIALDEKQLVFVEVRYRKSAAFGGGAASVDNRKQRKLSKAAAWYLQSHQLTNSTSCRFDVVAVTGKSQYLAYNWIKNAFDAHY